MPDLKGEAWGTRRFWTALLAMPILKFQQMKSSFGWPLFNLEAVLWDFEQPEQKLSSRSFYTKQVPAHPAAPVELKGTHLVPNAEDCLQVRRTGDRRNDPLSESIGLGMPKDLTSAQLARMNELTQDLAETDKAMRGSSDGAIESTIPMNSNDIAVRSRVIGWGGRCS